MKRRSTCLLHPLVGTFLSALLAAPLAMATVSAQPGPLSLEEAARLAVTAEPGQQRLLHQAEGLAAQAEGAALLPDPKLRLGLANVPTDTFDLEQEAMTQAVVGINQMFPKGDSLRFASRNLAAQGRSLEQQAAERRRQVALGARQAWLEAWYWEQSGELVRDNRQLFEQLVQVTESLFGIGRKSESDLIGAELELSRLDLRLATIEEKARQNRAALAQWVGDAASQRPLSEPAAPAPLPALPVLEQAVRRHPALAAVAARIEAGEAAQELAAEQFKPGFGVDLSYGARGGDRADLASAVLTVDFPLFGSGKQSAQQRAAIQSTASERARQVELYRQLVRELQVQYSRDRELAAQLALYDQQLLPKARQQSKAALAAYQNDRGDFTGLLRAYIGELNLALDHQRLRADRLQVRSAIENLVGAPESDPAVLNSVNDGETR